MNRPISWQQPNATQFREMPLLTAPYCCIRLCFFFIWIYSCLAMLFWYIVHFSFMRSHCFLIQILDCQCHKVDCILQSLQIKCSYNIKKTHAHIRAHPTHPTKKKSEDIKFLLAYIFWLLFFGRIYYNYGCTLFIS